MNIVSHSERVIQAVALAWHERGVKTPEDAKKESTDYNTAHTAISKAFGLGRPLAMIEKQFVEKWQKDWSIDLSVILEACNRTMLKIQKADFKYTDGILDNWHKSGIKTGRHRESNQNKRAVNRFNNTL